MRRALVVGGTKGLGLEIARRAQSHGTMPIVAGRSVDRDKGLEIGGCRADSVLLDVTSGVSVDYAMKDIGDVTDIDTLFFVAGQPPSMDQLLHTRIEELWNLYEVMCLGWMRVVRAFHERKKAPYALVTVASTTAWKVRPEGEVAYAGAKAAQAAMAANFHNELIVDFPGSRSLIVYPGGMKTDFLAGTGRDTSLWMDPAEVARLIWRQINLQMDPIVHMQIERKNGRPDVSFGPRPLTV